MKLKPKKYRRLIFDAETDGLLNQVTVCHCIVVRDYDEVSLKLFMVQSETICTKLANLV